MHAEYNICDDTIYFYPPAARFDDATKKRIQSMNGRWFPGRKCYAFKWSTDAEDFVLEYVNEVLENDTPDDVSERMERFERYAEDALKQTQSSMEYSADATTVRRRERAAARAESEASRAEYWNRRIEGAAARARQKTDPGVVARRLKGLRSDLAKLEKYTEANRVYLVGWSTLDLTYEGAKYLAGRDHFIPYGAWSRLADAEEEQRDEVMEQVKKEAIEYHQALAETYFRRREHYQNLIAYNNAILEQLGGNPAEKWSFEVGGQVSYHGRWSKVVKVMKVNLLIEQTIGYGRPWHTKISKTEVRDYRSPQEAVEASDAA